MGVQRAARGRADVDGNKQKTEEKAQKKRERGRELGARVFEGAHRSAAGGLI